MKKAVIFYLTYFRFLVRGEESFDGEGLIGASF